MACHAWMDGGVRGRSGWQRIRESRYELRPRRSRHVKALVFTPPPLRPSSPRQLPKIKETLTKSLKEWQAKEKEPLVVNGVNYLEAMGEIEVRTTLPCCVKAYASYQRWYHLGLASYQRWYHPPNLGHDTPAHIHTRARAHRRASGTSRRRRRLRSASRRGKTLRTTHTCPLPSWPRLVEVHSRGGAKVG